MTNGEADSSDKENAAPRAGAQRNGGNHFCCSFPSKTRLDHDVEGAGKNVDTVITASTWLSNILPTPKEELDRELSPSPQQRAVIQVDKQTKGHKVLVTDKRNTTYVFLITSVIHNPISG